MLVNKPPKILKEGVTFTYEYAGRYRTCLFLRGHKRIPSFFSKEPVDDGPDSDWVEGHWSFFPLDFIKGGLND